MTMRFRVGQQEFASAVTWAARSLSARPPLTVSVGVRIDTGVDQVRLTGYDYTVSNEADLSATGTEPGSVLVSGRLLAEVVRSLPQGAIEVTVHDGRLVIRGGSVRFGLPLLPIEDYPVLPPLPPSVGRVEGAALAAAVAQVAPARAHDDLLPVLTGIQLRLRDEQIELSSTDRYRGAVTTLAWQPCDPATHVTALVPGRMLADAASALAKAPQVTLALSEVAPATDGPSQTGVLGIDAGERRTTARLLDSTLPSLDSRWPTEFTAVVDVPSQALRTAVRRVRLVAGPTTPIVLSLAESEVRVSAAADTSGDAEEVLPARLSGQPLTVGFNVSYLLDGVECAAVEEVRLSVTGPGKPAVISAAPPDKPAAAAGAAAAAATFRYLVMTLRLP